MRTCTSLLLVAALTLHLTPVAAADGVDSAETYAETCAQCHGRTGRGMASFPRIAGKSEAFVAERLLQYRAGETVGPNSSLMIAAVAHLTDEDIAGLAAYIDENFE